MSTGTPAEPPESEVVAPAAPPSVLDWPAVFDSWCCALLAAEPQAVHSSGAHNQKARRSRIPTSIWLDFQGSVELLEPGISRVVCAVNLDRRGLDNRYHI